MGRNSCGLQQHISGTPLCAAIVMYHFKGVLTYFILISLLKLIAA